MKFLGRVAAQIFWTAVGLSALIATVAGMLAGSSINPIVGLLFVAAGGFLVVLVHELGHALAAMLVGWRVAIFHVAPLTLVPRPFAMRFDGALRGPDVAGFVLPVPRDLAHDTWLRSAFISAGAPIASWLLAAVCFYAAYAAWGVRPDSFASRLPDIIVPVVVMDRHEEALRTIAAAFGVYSVISALATSLPASRPSGWMNDAAQIAYLLRRRPPSRMLKTATEIARRLQSYDVPASAFEPWMVEALEKEAARRKLFAKFLDALHEGCEVRLRSEAEELGAAHPNTSEALVAQGLVAVELDGDVARADFSLSAAHDLRDADVLSVRQLALAAILRLEGENEAADRKLDEIPAATGAGRALAARVSTTSSEDASSGAPSQPHASGAL